jgi:MFS superfamily sulfate permease-like transporter
MALSPVFPTVLSWGRLYHLSNLKNDVVAALTVAAVALPQGLAYARLAEVDPIHGVCPVPVTQLTLLLACCVGVESV